MKAKPSRNQKRPAAAKEICQCSAVEPRDPELAAMEAMLVELKRLNQSQRGRVLAWLSEKSHEIPCDKWDSTYSCTSLALSVGKC
jgi:hypothetical protein